MESGGEAQFTDVREQAIASLKKKQAFKAHLLTYVCVNVFLVVIWAVAGGGFFWPVFPIFGWGLGVAANAWDVYGRREISEEEIQREAERIRGGGAGGEGTPT